MSTVIFLTGATGFIGAQIARRFVNDTTHTLVVLVRAQDTAAATRRLMRAWWQWRELAESFGDRVHVLCGDVSEPRLGLDPATFDNLMRQVTHIIHTAADLRVNAPIDALRKTNVLGTANMLELARAAHRDHGLERFSHVSTAYVCGARNGEIPEDALTDEFGFSSAYELSKFEGERLVQAAMRELPVSVFRPGMVVGESQLGYIKTFNTFYFPLRLYLAGKFRIVPADPALRVNIVPVDYIVDSMVRLTFNPRAVGMNFHLTAPPDCLPTARELADFVQEWAQHRLQLNLPRSLFIPPPLFALRGHNAIDFANGHRERGVLDALLTLAPYFNERKRFLRDNTERLLGHYAVKWRELLPPILDYAIYLGFMHSSERTVHEQILFRLESKSRPVTYHDVIEGKIVTRSSVQVRQEILAAASALSALGIHPGDRVAIVGLNSTRYLCMEVAIGLVGAVSVPLYYTSPPSDIERILTASGAHLLCVGAPRLLERLGELETQLPIVSFCRGARPPDLSREVMEWDEFLALGAGHQNHISAPVGFGDIVTIRYTSGTTGAPKGVVYNHGQLKWMALSLASLPRWKVRNTKITYLSFLPMNHVVEGILATYSPYYAPAPLDIYFLEDFRELQRALPRIKPTIFFGVPRLYEKVWDAFRENKLGRWYLRSREGIAKRLLRPVLRWQLLRKAGLDRSAQLIVGSAPAGEGLLRSFHELGIEIHNAYGLTEAPLVTLNRLGANRLGTAGEPLPETEVRVAEDGEILVRGPQVTAGYFNANMESPFREGWLCTGDLGFLTKDGSLVIQGRKKELIVTSYAKKIHPEKVEALLRGIPGVVDAMLVGNGKPYCAALLWVRDRAQDQSTRDALKRGIAEANVQLSHPEQVKRWAILPYDLSIEGGDLTANLKFKRQAVARRYAKEIAALYDECDTSQSVLHLDRIAPEDRVHA